MNLLNTYNNLKEAIRTCNNEIDRVELHKALSVVKRTLNKIYGDTYEAWLRNLFYGLKWSWKEKSNWTKSTVWILDS